jgi:ribosomal protein S18 acetylase RimI-like enzyme
MELANMDNVQAGNVRLANRGDEWEIARLLRNGRFLHAHPDWYEPKDWIGERGFVLLPEEDGTGMVKRPLFGTSPRLQACLAIAADPLPAAWVRVMAVRGDGAVGEIGDRLWAAVRAQLTNTPISEIGWLLTDAWPLPYLRQWGFSPAYEIETYMKEDVDIPSIHPLPSIQILPAKLEDMAALAAMETAVFAPLWQSSEQALMRALARKLSFDVAWYNNRPVGYQISNRSGMGAHLARITVAADWQGQGVGAVLMAEALRGYQRAELYWVSLNTQLDSAASRGLYAKFGFRETAVRYPIWTMQNR